VITQSTPQIGDETVTSVEIGGETIILRAGKLAKQADGAVVVESGDTVILATVVGRGEAREGADFFPLTVDIEEKMYAAGKIPGGFFKREGRASEKATLNARMVDRPIRPLWPKGFRNEVQIIGTVLSVDGEHAHDVMAINGASAALTISPLPFLGPVGAVRVGRFGNELVLNPALGDMAESTLDLVVCGTSEAITMVEAGAKVVEEEMILEALALAHEAIKKLCAAQLELRDRIGKPKWYEEDVREELEARYAPSFDAHLREHGLAGISVAESELLSAELPPVPGDAGEDVMVRRIQVAFAARMLADDRRLDAVLGAVEAQFGADLRELSDAEQDSKELKSAKRSALYDRIESEIDLPFPARAENGALDALTRSWVRRAADAAYKRVVRQKIAVDKRRPDGRAAEEIRPINCEVSVAPRTHGSALFTRGQTQALTLVTLGTAKEEQRIDDLSLDTTKRYIHHYNFPPFSVGETGFMRGPKRRDIGHGALAERALVPVIPGEEEFPYTLRLVSEILESNGSSSMASVCGSTLGLMDAGVPIKAPVAGIAMGLIKEGSDLVVLTDIQGAEDHLGDMDFKVAGTADGITALQMDIKITGVDTGTLRRALSQARDARIHILERMAEALPAPRESLSEFAPQVLSVKIDPDQIGMIIGKGGETIRGLEEEFDVKIDIEEDGFVRLYASDGIRGEQARARIEEMTRPIAVGDLYRDRRVVKTADFGAFVELRKGTDGLLHVSRVAPGVRIDSIEQVLSRGDIVTVEVTEVDTERGRIALRLVSKREGDGEVTAEQVGARYKEQFPNAGQGGDRPPRDRGDRGDRGDREGGGGYRPRRRGGGGGGAGRDRS
jgi:polyribonucleotide nucleotidyltransferase